MANFSVSIGTDQELNDSAHALLNRFKTDQGDTDKTALRALLDWAGPLLDDVEIKANGGDMEGMNAAIDTIRQLYMASVLSRREIIENRDDEIAKIKERADQAVRDAASKAEEASDAMEKAKEAASAAEDARDAAERARESAEAQADAEKQLRIAKEEKITEMQSRLTEALDTANRKIAEADELQKEKADLEKALTEKGHELELQEFGFKKELADLERKLTEKDHELEIQKLTLQKDYESRIARLETQIEILRDKDKDNSVEEN